MTARTLYLLQSVPLIGAYFKAKARIDAYNRNRLGVLRPKKKSITYANCW
jgi:hypothetical protein